MLREKQTRGTNQIGSEGQSKAVCLKLSCDVSGRVRTQMQISAQEMAHWLGPGGKTHWNTICTKVFFFSSMMEEFEFKKHNLSKVPRDHSVTRNSDSVGSEVKWKKKRSKKKATEELKDLSSNSKTNPVTLANSLLFRLHFLSL